MSDAAMHLYKLPDGTSQAARQDYDTAAARRSWNRRGVGYFSGSTHRLLKISHSVSDCSALLGDLLSRVVR